LAVKNEKTRTIENWQRESGVAELSGTEIWSDFTVVGSWDGKYKSAEALLKCGADPNIASTVDGMTPLYLAAGFLG